MIIKDLSVCTSIASVFSPAFPLTNNGLRKHGSLGRPQRKQSDVGHILRVCPESSNFIIHHYEGIISVYPLNGKSFEVSLPEQKVIDIQVRRWFYKVHALHLT